MHRLAMATMAVIAATVGACGGGGNTRPASQPPTGRAPELVSVAPSCDGATLRAFDPGLPGIERVSVEERRQPDAPLDREYVRICELAEDDEACLGKARRDVLAADPDATIGAVAINGVSEGWSAQLDVDGQRRELRVPNEADVVIEARRLQSLGHQVVPVEGHVVYRAGSRRARVGYKVPMPGVEDRLQWEATLRWPVPADIPVAVEQLRRETESAKLVVLRFEVAVDGLTAVVACP